MPIQINNETYLNTDEATRRLGVSRQTLDSLVKQGLLNKYKQGVRKLVYFKQAEIEALITMRRVEPGNE